MAGLLALIDDSLIDKVLEGTSVGFENGLLEIRLYNGIFRNGDDSIYYQWGELRRYMMDCVPLYAQ